MPTTPLPQDPDLDQLRRQARELQRAVRLGDPSALALIAEFSPGRSRSLGRPRTEFALADAQLVIARRHGFGSWARLRHHIDVVTRRSWRPDRPVPAEETAADRFLRLVCLTYSDDESADQAAAARFLTDHPDLPSQNLFVAAACADLAEVRRQLAVQPSTASATGGVHGWSPLLYQSYARVDPVPTKGATLETAQLLLKHGADPNDGRFWHGLPTPFTVLTGVFGDGEGSEPPHPHAIPFARLLLEHGADPNDGQTLYNRMFSADDQHLRLLFEFGLGQSAGGPWFRLLGDQLESPTVMLRNLLAWAVTHDQRDRVRLLARHGVDVESPLVELRGHHGRGRTPVDLALLSGHRELADDLVRLGAAPGQLGDADAFIAAAMAGDTDAVAGFSDDVVDRVRQRRPGLMVWAAAQGAPQAIELLARKGFEVSAFGRGDVPGEQPWQTALHAAAERGDADQARRLLALGADPTLRDHRFDGTPADWARHFGHSDLAAELDRAALATAIQDDAEGRRDD